MKVIFTKLAKIELEEAINYYEMEFAGLGNRFKTEIKTAVHRIVEYPTAWSIEKDQIRKCY